MLLMVTMYRVFVVCLQGHRALAYNTEYSAVVYLEHLPLLQYVSKLSCTAITNLFCTSVVNCVQKDLW